jgi:anti-sigma factor RsiW
MTPPPDPADLPGPWPDVLAAYADGELDEVARARVERWLDENPQAWPCAVAQFELSPENWQLWRDAEPPCPGSLAWESVQAGVAARLAAEPARPASPRLRTPWALTALACGLLLAVFSFGAWRVIPARQEVAERAVSRPTAEDPLAGFAVLPIVTEAEVDVQRVDAPGSGGWLPVGGMPLTGQLALARADDVAVEEAEDHPAWPGGAPRVVRDPADMPVLFPDR